MTRTFRSAVSVVAAASMTSGFVARADDSSIISIETGHSAVIKAHDVVRIAVGDSKVAGVVPIGRNSVVVNGKAAGHTTVFVWQGTEMRSYEVTVSEGGLGEIARMIQTAIAEPNVRVQTFGANTIVSGTVPDAAAYNRVMDVLNHVGDLKYQGAAATGDGKVINLVTVSKPLGNLQDEVAKITTGGGVRADLDSSGNVVVSGSVRDKQQEQQVLDRVKTLAGGYLRGDGKVVDRLGIQTTSQVDIKVYVLEVDRTAANQLGIRLQTAIPGQIYPNGNFTIGNSQSIVALQNHAPQTGMNPLSIGGFGAVSALAPTLDVLESTGHAKLLSSPNLVAAPGQEATFLVGGEIPIPVSNGLGTVSIDYKQFGVQLAVTPTILGSGAVETKIAPEVSDLDFADGIQINGFTIPAFKTSKLSTDVVTQSGESIIMGGLIRRIEQKNIVKFPILGEIPILGQFFRDTTYNKTDTDVVFVMTPTILTK